MSSSDRFPLKPKILKQMEVTGIHSPPPPTGLVIVKEIEHPHLRPNRGGQEGPHKGRSIYASQKTHTRFLCRFFRTARCCARKTHIPNRNEAPTYTKLGPVRVGPVNRKQFNAPPPPLAQMAQLKDPRQESRGNQMDSNIGSEWPWNKKRSNKEPDPRTPRKTVHRQACIQTHTQQT